jgi:hypothetical protein
VQRYKLAECYANGEFSNVIAEMDRISGELMAQMQENSALTATEKNLIDIYLKVFGVSHIDKDDNFVDCGGNSILLVQASEMIDRLYPGRVSVVNLFAYPNIRELAQFIDSDKRVVIPALNIPEQYFTVDNSNDNNHSFEIMFDGQLYNGLLKVADLAGVRTCDVLLSMYVYLMREISGENKVPVQVMVQSGDVVSVEVDFNDIEDFGSFFSLIRFKTSDLKGAVV